jgi:DNA phosphorothioation-associated putative methyltransferase
MAAEIFDRETKFFDYGCGTGGDVSRMQALGYDAGGWDPYYFPDPELVPADVVNIGYVINVIEDPQERDLALAKAWSLTTQVLIISAQVLVRNMSNVLAYGDGILTKRNTFQKYYSQAELKEYIDRILNVDAIPIGLGIYLVFKDLERAQSFRLSRLHSRLSTPKVRIESKRYEDYQAQLQPLIDFVSQRGRLPIKGELPEEAELIQEFSSFKRAFGIILSATDEAEWDAIAYYRSLDLQVYLALALFEGDRQLRNLSPSIRADIKAFFGSFEEACAVADRMLLKIGNPGLIAQLCRKSKAGKLLPTALYIHVSTLSELDPHLRLYEGCASRYLGDREGANLIKFHTEKHQISYLYYPDFDTNPHPQLARSILVDLKQLDIKFREYSHYQNPPILHRQETFLSPHHPQYAELQELTRQEEAAGLYADPKNIGSLKGWEQKLADLGLEIRDFKLVKINKLSGI